MSKRFCSTSSDGHNNSSAKHRKVKFNTFHKWLTDYDRDYKTLIWLDLDMSWENGEIMVDKLKCKI